MSCALEDSWKCIGTRGRYGYPSQIGAWHAISEYYQANRVFAMVVRPELLTRAYDVIGILALRRIREYNLESNEGQRLLGCMARG